MRKFFIGSIFLFSVIACNLGVGTGNVDIDSFKPGDAGSVPDAAPEADAEPTEPLYEQRDASALDAAISHDSGIDAANPPVEPKTCQEAKLECGNFHPADGSHVQSCGSCQEGFCSNGVFGGSCVSYAIACKKNQPAYIGTCETFTYTFDKVKCSLDMLNRESVDYFNSHADTPAQCITVMATFICDDLTKPPFNVGTTVWNTANAHDGAVGGAELDYAYVGGADALCQRTIHWLYSPFWTQRDAEKLAADQGQVFVFP